MYSAVDGEKLIASDYVSIEYLCSTDVVFLPPYTVDYSFYSNELFNVYGDYAVRVSEIAGSHIIPATRTGWRKWKSCSN